MEGTWDEFLHGVFVEIGPKFQERKLEVPLIVPVQWKAGATKKELEQVESIWIGSLDFDGENKEGITPQQYEDILQRLHDEGLEALVYSTWGHAKVRPNYKIRVLVPLSRAVNAREWKQVWSAFNGLLGSIADASCKDPSRGYFWPSAPSDSDRSELILKHVYGRNTLDVDFLLSGWEDRGVSEEDVIREITGKKLPKVSRNQLKRFAQRRSRSKNPGGASVGDKLLLVIDGEAFAEDGERDNTCFVLAKELAREFPNCDASSIAEHFSASLSSMGEGAPTVEKVAEKIQRAQASLISTQRLQEQAREARLQDLPEKYTIDHIAEICRRMGSDADPYQFSKQLLLQSGNNFFVFDRGKYRKCARSEIQAVCRDALVPFEELYDARAHNLTNTGEKPKTVDQLMYDYGTVVNRHVMQLGVRATHTIKHAVTQELVLIEAVTPIREDLVPEHSERVADWLQAICPNEGTHEMLLDWLAVFPDLQRPLAMLVLVGDTGLGKTEFATALGRIWCRPSVSSNKKVSGKQTWTHMREIFENFNSDVLACPLLLADEEFPRDSRGYVPTAKIRTLIGSNVRGINEKHLHKVPLEGNFRFMATANNLDRVSFGGTHNKEDLRAIGERIRVIEIPRSAVGLFDYPHFVLEEAVAKHALWLNANRDIREHKRFGVDKVDNSPTLKMGHDESYQRLMSWLVDFLGKRTAEKLDNMPVFVHGGRLFVNSELLHALWEQQSSNPPPVKNLRNAVRNISEGVMRYKNKAGVRRKYQCVLPLAIKNYLRETGDDDEFYMWQLQVDTLPVLEYRRRTLLATGEYHLAIQRRELALTQVERLKVGLSVEVTLEQFASAQAYQLELESSDS